MTLISILFTVLQVLPLHRDIDMTSVNAQTRRTELIMYSSEEEARSLPFEKSPFYLDLNGTWNFLFFNSEKDIPAQLGGWGKITVPGNWEFQGYGTPVYVNTSYDFAAEPHPPVIPDDIPVGIYMRTFTVPAAWAGRKVYLNLCGAKSGVYTSVNGKDVGYSEDSKDLARFDITPYLKEGENELMLKCTRWSSGSYLECQDFWRVSGLERDVYLSSESMAESLDLNVVADYDLANGDGIFSLATTVPAEYKLIAADGTVVSEGSAGVRGVRIPAVKPWSAEEPNLYALLLNAGGDHTRFDVGFRHLEIRGNVFYFNGAPIKFKGVNMHEHNEFTGHWCDREYLRRNLVRMRELHINAIRTCHYPQPREFYELCDSLGFYVYDEANIESHGMGYDINHTLGNKPEWMTKHIDRTLNMYRRTANYPCVTILSLGNEAGNGVNFYETYKILKALEKDGQNRPVVYERAEFQHNTDFINPMYPDTRWLKKMGETYGERPIALCEYTHAMGNSNGSLDLMWDQFYAHVHLQGGFIWDWVDQGLYDKERGWTYGGDYGVNPPSDGNFCCNGIVGPDRDPHPAFYEVKHQYQNISVTAKDLEKGVFQVFNRFYFTRLSGQKIKWWVERDGKRIFLAKGKVKLNVGPQEYQEFKVRLPRMKKPGQYRIFFTTEGACDEIFIKDTSAPKKALVKRYVGFTDGDTRIVVRGQKVELVFDKEEGVVKSWKVKGKDMIDPEFGIRPNFWRAPIDNDYGNLAPQRTAMYKEAWKPVSVTAEEAEGTVRIMVEGEGVRGKEVWTVFPDGVLKIEVETKAQPALKGVEIPRLGIRFHVADDEFKYFGRGPLENYWDRSSCTFKSIYKSAASKEYYPYVRPQECGHHTDVNWLTIGGLTVQGLFEFNALRQTIEDLDGGITKSQTHITDVPVRDFTEVSVDYKMSGIGGYDSWGARPEPDYTLWSTESYSYCFTLIPSKKPVKTVY